MIDVLLTQYAFSQSVLKRNTAGLTHEESVYAPQEGGNCVNWILGHMVASRNSLLELLGEEKIWDETDAQRYARGSASIADSTGAVPLSQLLSDFETSQARIVAGLKKLDPLQLSDDAPAGAARSKVQTLGESLAIYSFHESYHLGQLGVLRRILGKGDGIT
jgi:uncharacterized damage-inducible protein DinB